MKILSTYMHLAGVIAISLLMLACSKKYEPISQQPEDVIGLAVALPATRATTFDSPASLLNPEIGGGDLMVSAYVAGSSSNAGKCHIDNVRVNYFTAAGDWRFTDDDGRFVSYYWPLGEKLNFFAYMPYDAVGGTEAIVSNLSYTHGTGPSFEYELPLDSQSDLREFIYAYTEDQDIHTQNADPSNPGVKLEFKHPFAAVYFELGQSYRMKLHDITISDIQYSGEYQYDNGWTLMPDNKRGNLVISIENDIPDPINYFGPIGGPYLVSPQTISDASELIVRYTRLDGTVGESAKIDMKNLSTTWQAGRKYTYTINLGKTEEEILFKVKVDKWESIGYKNEIDVE